MKDLRRQICGIDVGHRLDLKVKTNIQNFVWDHIQLDDRFINGRQVREIVWGEVKIPITNDIHQK